MKFLIVLALLVVVINAVYSEEIGQNQEAEGSPLNTVDLDGRSADLQMSDTLRLKRHGKWMQFLWSLIKLKSLK